MVGVRVGGGSTLGLNPCHTTLPPADSPGATLSARFWRQSAVAMSHVAFRFHNAMLHPPAAEEFIPEPRFRRGKS